MKWTIWFFQRKEAAAAASHEEAESQQSCERACKSNVDFRQDLHLKPGVGPLGGTRVSRKNLGSFRALTDRTQNRCLSFTRFNLRGKTLKSISF